VKIQVNIADDHPMVIKGVQNMLGSHEDIVVTGTYSDGIALLDGLKVYQPDVLLLDIQMPGKTGDELAPVLAKKYPGMRVLALTNFDSTLHVQNMLRHGVLGYLLKTTDKETLVSAIKAVYKGEIFIQHEMKDKLDLAGLRMKREVSTKSNLTPPGT
jgi:DNA-binding NarL/FixJ family response regulator